MPSTGRGTPSDRPALCGAAAAREERNASVSAVRRTPESFACHHPPLALQCEIQRATQIQRAKTKRNAAQTQRRACWSVRSAWARSCAGVAIRAGMRAQARGVLALEGLGKGSGGVRDCVWLCDRAGKVGCVIEAGEPADAEAL